jgi:hypothetical protein
MTLLYSSPHFDCQLQADCVIFADRVNQEPPEGGRYRIWDWRTQLELSNQKASGRKAGAGFYLSPRRAAALKHAAAGMCIKQYPTGLEIFLQPFFISAMS